MSQKAHENRKDFKFFDKTSVEEICLMYGGRLFLARGAETENARSPNVEKVRCTLTHTYTAVLRPFARDYPVAEETFTCNVLRESVIMDFMKCTDNPAGCHPIRTIDAPTSIIPRILHQMPFLSQPSWFILAWDRHQVCWTAYLEAWLHTWKLRVYSIKWNPKPVSDTQIKCTFSLNLKPISLQIRNQRFT